MEEETASSTRQKIQRGSEASSKKEESDRKVRFKKSKLIGSRRSTSSKKIRRGQHSPGGRVAEGWNNPSAPASSSEGRPAEKEAHGGKRDVGGIHMETKVSQRTLCEEKNR